MVQIREPCAACEGSGVRRIEAGSGHARWTRRAACEDCEGSGHRARWITLDELRAMLER
jgi:DnaJ-class molecular chaperone